MEDNTIRKNLDAYVKEKYGIEPEVMSFFREKHEVYRHPETGKLFAFFIVKERSSFGLKGEGTAEILSIKIDDPFFAEFLLRQPGYLRGYPNKKWNWVSMVLDGTVPFDYICKWLDRSYESTKNNVKKKKKTKYKIDI